MKIPSTSAMKIYYFELSKKKIWSTPSYLNWNLDGHFEINRDLMDIIYENF